MKDLRIEIVDGGAGVYLAVDPDGVWARSTELDETITADWDAQGRILGLEIAGDAAVGVVTGLVDGLLSANVRDTDGLRETLRTIGLGLDREPLGRGSSRGRSAPGGKKLAKTPATPRTRTR